MTQMEKISVQGFLDDFKEMYEKAVFNMEKEYFKDDPFIVTKWAVLDNVKLSLEKWGLKLYPIL